MDVRPEYLTEDELVEYTRRGKKYWYRQRCAGRIRFSKLGKVVVYRLADVEAFIEDRSYCHSHPYDLSSPAGPHDRI